MLSLSGGTADDACGDEDKSGYSDFFLTEDTEYFNFRRRTPILGMH